MEPTVRELLAAAQADRKAKLDAGHVDCVPGRRPRAASDQGSGGGIPSHTVFKYSRYSRLRTTDLPDAAYKARHWSAAPAVGRSLDGDRLPEPQRLHPRRSLALPRRMRCRPAVNVDRYKPFFERAGAPPATRDRRVSTRRSSAPARGHALAGALAWAHVRRRRVAARGGGRFTAATIGGDDAAAHRRRAGRQNAPPLPPARRPPPPSCRHAAAARRPRRPHHHRSATSRNRYATSCRPAAGSRSGRLPAAGSRRGGHGPRFAGLDGAALDLAMAGSWAGGPA